MSNHELHVNEKTEKGMDKISHYGWNKAGDVGRLVWIDKTLLKVNHDYQRENIAKERVLKIAKNWMWPACGVLVVAKKDDGLFVVDGQHRLLAAMKRSDCNELPCIVFDLEELSDEAKAFLEINTNRNAAPVVDKIKALTIAGDEDAALVLDLIEQSNRVPAKASSPTTVSCLHAMYMLAKQDRDLLTNIWPLVTHLCEGESIHNKLLLGLAYIEKRMGDGSSLTTGKWRRRVIDVGREALLRAANEASAYYARGGAGIWAAGIEKAINKGLRNRLPVDLGR